MRSDQLTEHPSPSSAKFKGTSSKKFKVSWLSKSFVSLSKTKRFVLIMLSGLVIHLLCFYGDRAYNNITSFSDSLFRMRLDLAEVNIMPRILGYNLLSDEGIPLHFRADSVLNSRKKILKNLYGYANQLKNAQNIFYGSQINQIEALIKKNMTEAFVNKDGIGNSFYRQKMVSVDFSSTEFFGEFIAKIQHYSQPLNADYSDVFPIIENGLKYTIIANIDNCDFLLKAFSTKTYSLDSALQQNLERINHKLLLVIEFGFHMIFSALATIMHSSAAIYLGFVLSALLLLAVCLGYVLAKVFSFLGRDAAEEAYMENNILNLMDTVTLEEMEEKFNRAVSQISFFKVTF